MRFLRTAFLVLWFFTPTIASAQVSLSLGSTTIAAGSSGNVSATLTNDATAVALQFDVVYDPSLLSISSVLAGSALTANHTLTSNSIGAGRQRLVITTSPVTPLLSGTLATVTLAANGAAPATVTPLTFDGVVISDAAAIAIIPTGLSNGSITITAGAPPPASPASPIPTMSVMGLGLLSLLIVLLTSWKGGRAVRASTLAILALCLLPLSDRAFAQSIPGDANGDGQIDTADVLLIVERILERGVLPGDGDCNRDTIINVLDTICTQLPFVPGETDPIILGPGDRSIPAGVAFQMNLFAADPDTGSTLSWELVSGPTGLSVDAAGVLNWTPATADIGDNPVSVRVTDNTARTGDATFDISVFTLPLASPANAAPTLTVPADQTILVGAPLALQATAVDSDVGDTLTFRLIDAPADMTIDPATGAISWPAQANALATADVVVSVADAAGETAFGRFTVRADAPNGAPTATDDVYVARKGETLTVAASEGVIQNDRDPNDDTLNASSLSDPTLGTLDSFNTDGSFSYTTIAPTPITIGLVEKCSTTALTIAGTTSVADMDGDGDVEMAGIVISGNFARVFIADPSDCSHEFFPLADGLGQPNFFALTTLVNLDDDPELELVAPYSRFSDSVPDSSIPGADERMMAVNIDGTPLAAWGPGGLSEALDFEGRFAEFQQLAGPVAADLDGDGNPELIMGFNNAEPLGTGSTSSNAVIAYDGRTGTIIWEFRGGITRPENRGISPVLVDLDLDGDTEIIWNQFVLDHTGALLFELPAEQTIFGGGNTFLTTAIANFDTDAFPEILAYDRSNLYLFTHTGAIIWQRPFISNGSFSDLTIAELDGDPFPEFVAMLGTTVPTGNVDRPPATLYAFDSDGQDLWNNIADGFLVRTLTATRTSTPVAFDLDQDGIDELIQVRVATAATASGLYIINGETGETIDFQVSPTTNSYDQALTVADVDGDGSAEIITSPAINFGLQSLQVWDNLPGNPFPPARSIRTQHNVQPTWVNAEGTPLSEIKPHWLQPGRNGWNMIQPDVDPLAPEQDSFTYRVSDGEFDSNTATVNIEVRPAGNPPFFISEPDTATSRGAAYEYRVLTVDVDPGDVVSYALVNGPPGMSIDAQSGVLSWYADANGEYPVSIIASDTVGRSTAQIYRLAVGDPVVVPDVVGNSEAAAGTALGNANLFTGDVFRRIHPTLAAGTVYEQSPIAGSAAAFGASVDLFISSGPGPLNTDDDGDTYTENQGDCNDADANIRPGATDTDGDGIDQDCDGIDGNKVLVSIELTPDSKRVLTNSPVPLTAMGIFDDGTAQNLTAIATWTRGPTFFEANSGNFTAQASFSGVTGSAVINVVDRVAEDLAPVASIDSPDVGGTISGPTDIVGTASDTTLLRWELAYQQDGEGDFTLFAQDSSQVLDDVIAEFDTSVLLNGLYNIRLRVFDRGGNVSEDTTTVIVDSQLKVGNFTLSYLDLELPLNGIPIRLTRNYDSRDKRVGDFGVGWKLGVDSIEIKTNRELGTGWQVFRQGLVFGLVETDAHIAAIRMPGGRIEAFKMVVGPAVSPIIPFPPLTQSVSFQPLPGTSGTLESLEERNVSIFDPQPGPVSLLRDSDGGLYNPTLFRYTAPDGFKLDIDTVDGIQRAETPAGQVLTITPTRISHSNGTVVDIERDVVGRITSITDPGGFTQSYTYDANGDLRAHSDQEDFVTRFDYDADHNVINITDPLNRTVVRNEYDDQGRLISVTDEKGSTTRFEHDIDGRRELVTDAAGFVTSIQYDNRGNIVRVVDPLGGVSESAYDEYDNRILNRNQLGEEEAFTYDSRNNLTSVTNPVGATTRYEYDNRDQLVKVVDALGRETRYVFDADGTLSETLDANGHMASFLRDSVGNVVARIDESGRMKRFKYNSVGYQTAATDGRGNTVTRSFDENGTVLTRTNAKGDTHQFSSDGRGLVSRVTAPEGNSMDFSFNGIGQLQQAIDAADQSVEIAEDARGNVLRVVDPNGGNFEHRYDSRNNRIASIDQIGRQTLYAYDALGRLTQTIDPAGNTYETTYDAVGRVVALSDSNSSVTSYEYDVASRNTAVVDALGNRTEFEYDLEGNLTSRIDARGNATVYVYDLLNRLAQTEFPDGSFETSVYDAVGNIVSETDRLGRSKTYRYDENSNLTSVSDIDGGVTNYSYDPNNNRISQTDVNGHTTRMTFDNNNRLTAKQYSDGSVERYSYNDAGQLSRTVLPDGRFIEATLDGVGRTTTRNLNGEGSETFVYDGSGLLTQAVNLWGTVSYSYDPSGRVAEIRSEGGHTVRYDYDNAGNRTGIVTQLAGQLPRETRYVYDAVNRPITIIEPDGDTSSYTYDPVGNVATITYPNGVLSSFTYDNVNQLTRIEHRQGATTLAAYDYTLDAGGRRLRVDHANGDSVEYQYDIADRLLQETHRNAGNIVIFEQTYGYDAVGNRLTQQVSGQAQTILAYDSADKLLSAGATNFAYDANGRLTTRTAPQGTISYGYDVEGQLLRVTSPQGTVVYGYDANGKRRQRLFNGSEQHYLLDEASLTGYDQTLLAYDDADNTMAEYHWGDRLLSVDDGSNDRFYHFDASRNTRLLTDETGAVSDTYSYDAFGNVRESTGPADNPYGFAGEWQQEPEGLVYLRARFYDPETGRFISRDPFAGSVDDPMSLHRYLYANANPIMNVDPSGMSVTASLIEASLVSALVSGLASIVMDVVVLGKTDIAEIFINAGISAIFGAVAGAGGVGVARVAASKLATAAAMATSRGLIYVAVAVSRGLINAFVGIAQLATLNAKDGNKSEISGRDFAAFFVVSLFFETITLGMASPEWEIGLLQSAKSNVQRTGYSLPGDRAAAKIVLAEAAERGDDVLNVLKRHSNKFGLFQKDFNQRAFATAQLELLSSASEELLEKLFLSGRLFSNPGVITLFMETLKGSTIEIWNMVSKD